MSCEYIGHHAVLDEWCDVEVLPGSAVQSDADLDAFIASAASTHHHPAGTCRMGGDQTPSSTRICG
nr:GMC oxidoreductase [Mesorhizobium sp.]